MDNAGEAVKCRGCEQFWGTAASFGLCSRCSMGMEPKTKTTITAKNEVAWAKQSLKRCGVKLLDEAEAERVGRWLKTPYVGSRPVPSSTVYPHNSFVDVCVELMMSMGHRFALPMSVANKISAALYERCGQHPQYYMLSQALAAVTFMPWTIDLRENGWHMSTVCYKGNFGETPQDEAKLDEITRQPLVSGF